MTRIPAMRLCLSALLIAAGALATQSMAATTSAAEYSVKAAFLSKFGTFVQWPAAAFAEPTSALNICIVGADPFGRVLDEVVEGQYVESHPLRVKRLAAIEHSTDCQIVFVNGSDTSRALQVVEALRGTSVLTVTETGEETAGAGIINFLIRDNHVRFGVDDEAAQRNGLSISSRLLMLAVYVKAHQ